MAVGAEIPVKGYVTMDKYIAGRPLAEIEKILGFHAGRLRDGMTVAVLLELPTGVEFELGAYSNIAAHRFTMPTNLDIPKIKTQAMALWSLSGPNRLVKVFATIRHDPNIPPDVQYPPGQGAPQWVLTREKKARVVAETTGYPGSPYIAADRGR